MAKDRSAEVSMLDVSAKPKIVKHAKMNHLPGVLLITVFPMVVPTCVRGAFMAARLRHR